MHIDEIIRIPVGAGLPCPSPIYRPGEGIGRPLADTEHLQARSVMGVFPSCRDKGWRGEGWGPCACPRGSPLRLPWRRWGSRVTLQRGQAQGPRIRSTPPPVPTGGGTSSFARCDRHHAAGRQRRMCCLPLLVGNIHDRPGEGIDGPLADKSALRQ